MNRDDWSQMGAAFWYTVVISIMVIVAGFIVVEILPSGVGNSDDCVDGYDPCVEASPTDLDCADIGTTVSVTGSDPYGLDADHDGYGCEAE